MVSIHVFSENGILIEQRMQFLQNSMNILIQLYEYCEHTREMILP